VQASGCRRHSTPWSSGSLAANLAHPSAASFPGTPLCAGHQRISISTAGSRLRTAAIACPRLKGVARFVVRHPRNRSLSIREDADSTELMSLGPFRSKPIASTSSCFQLRLGDLFNSDRFGDRSEIRNTGHHSFT